MAARAIAAPAMFADGVQGLVDHRIADGGGWISFDVGGLRAPTIVSHGSDDSIVNVAQAAHTATVLPGARTKIVEGLAHLSIIGQVVPTLSELNPLRSGRLKGSRRPT